MFPLGSVLLPSMLMPLRIFEDRYRAMARVVMDGDETFGVVLIERGSEVGGGDVRSGVGCLARVLEADERPDGQWFLVCVGTDRLRVERWGDDAPYPNADVVLWPDEPVRDGDAEAVRALEAGFREVLELAGAGPGASSGALPVVPVELSDDPTTAVWQMATVSPFGAFDRHRLLAAPSLGDRVRLLAEMLEDTTAILRAERGG
jgi:Lon protease-like protein